jgi:hypothetical protein
MLVSNLNAYDDLIYSLSVLDTTGMYLFFRYRSCGADNFKSSNSLENWFLNGRGIQSRNGQHMQLMISFAIRNNV